MAEWKANKTKEQWITENLAEANDQHLVFSLIRWANSEIARWPEINQQELDRLLLSMGNAEYSGAKELLLGFVKRWYPSKLLSINNHLAEYRASGRFVAGTRDPNGLT